jgi:mono/diheme cytochrome c family protein
MGFRPLLACHHPYRPASDLLDMAAVVRWSFALLTGIAVAAGTARADLTGSYAGQLTLRHPPQATSAAAVLSESAGAVSGTVVLDTGDSALAGAYLVQGKRKGRRLRLRGLNPGGAKLALRATVAADALGGKARLRVGNARTKARLELTKLPSGDDGSSCDAVFLDNEQFFTTQVMDGVLVPICAACHVPGGQAAATRLHVVAGDPATTAHSTFAVIDPTTPADSLLLQKPLGRVPHGGGQRITEGSTEAQALADWVQLVAQASCSTPAQPTTGPELYAANCAGCHGSDAAGLDGRPDVRCTVRSRLKDAVRKGRGSGDTGMPAFTTEQLSDEQLGLIIDYLASLCSGSAEDVYASNCATCHGPRGAGGQNADGVRGPDIRCTEAGDFAEKLAQGEERMPAFPSLVDQATALARYVRSFCNGG